jgi:hypothetical protein
MREVREPGGGKEPAVSGPAAAARVREPEHGS